MLLHSPTFSADCKRRQTKSSPCPPYFPTRSAEPERRGSLRPAFPNSLHLVLTWT